VESTKTGSVGDAFTFDRYRLIPARQRLLRDGVVVPLGSRALEILTVLVRRSGELVSKHDLIAAVWPDTFVDESNLKVNVCLLRRSLGDTQKQPKYIATVAGRGYRFVAPVQRGIAAPTPQREIVDRQQEIADILAAIKPDHFQLRALPLLTARSTRPHL
jgi:DNA-binding winged helix-turn-helix (wHTH) protein